MRRSFAIVFSLVIFGASIDLPRLAVADEVAFDKHEDGVRVTLGGKPFTEYPIHKGPKPIVWPIIGPDGQEMTRNYP